jgi:hypothetical protein
VELAWQTGFYPDHKIPYNLCWRFSWGERMAQLRHALSGAVYTLVGDDTVRVENNGLTGLFTATGRHLEGELTHADPHMLVWLAGPQLPKDDPNARRSQRSWSSED